ncbi:Hypothetical protein POVN_LOCUS611 [uncultured virus]|nr:Hypothetical protein POVN_LOCUS611 [uncultured virus]
MTTTPDTFKAFIDQFLDLATRTRKLYDEYNPVEAKALAGWLEQGGLEIAEKGLADFYAAKSAEVAPAKVMETDVVVALSRGAGDARISTRQLPQSTTVGQLRQSIAKELGIAPQRITSISTSEGELKDSDNVVSAYRVAKPSGDRWRGEYPQAIIVKYESWKGVEHKYPLFITWKGDPLGGAVYVELNATPRQTIMWPFKDFLVNGVSLLDPQYADKPLFETLENWPTVITNIEGVRA